MIRFSWNIIQRYLILQLILLCGLSSCKEEIEINQEFRVDSVSYEIASYRLLDSTLNYHGFHLDSIKNSKKVPPVYVNSIQPSIKSLKKNIKKRNFVRTILSHTLKFNREIATTRISLIKTLNKDSLLRNDSIWLDSLCSIFRVKKQNYMKLINKVDVIPPSLIIVQGIIESGWATSKYAVEGNNLFGLYGSKRVKLKSGDSRPKAREFDSVEECVREYILNLNRHHSYRRMRVERHEMREKGIKITGRNLAKTLIRYSTLGERYVRKIVSMINYYELEEYDDYYLDEGTEIYINIKE